MIGIKKRNAQDCQLLRDLSMEMPIPLNMKLPKRLETLLRSGVDAKEAFSADRIVVLRAEVRG